MKNFSFRHSGVNTIFWGTTWGTPGASFYIPYVVSFMHFIYGRIIVERQRALIMNYCREGFQPFVFLSADRRVLFAFQHCSRFMKPERAKQILVFETLEINCEYPSFILSYAYAVIQARTWN